MIQGRQQIVKWYKPSGESKQTLGNKPNYEPYDDIYMTLSKTMGNISVSNNVSTYVGTHTGLIFSNVDIQKRDRIVTLDNTTYEVMDVTPTSRAIMVSLKEVN